MPLPTLPTLVSKTGAPVVSLMDWVNSKNDPALTALFNEHSAIILAGQPVVPMANPAMDDMFNQFLAETNQELVR